MQTLKNLTQREKIIVSVTAALVLVTLIYVGFLDDFVLNYQTLKTDLDLARREYKAQNELLRRGAVIDTEFDKVAQALPRGEVGKGPELVFQETVASLCREKGMAVPSIAPRRIKRIPDVPGFSYLILPIVSPGIFGNMEQVFGLLKAFHERNFLIRVLNINSDGKPGESMELQVTLELAQIARNEDIGETGEEVGRRRY